MAAPGNPQTLMASNLNSMCYGKERTGANALNPLYALALALCGTMPKVRSKICEEQPAKTGVKRSILSNNWNGCGKAFVLWIH